MRSPFPPVVAALLLVGAAPAVRAGDMPSMPGMAGMAACPTPDPDSGAEMVGKAAPRWTFTRWVGKPLSQEKLRGKVVLLRWWNVGCHYCEATLPEIESLRGRYGDDFVTVGVFHPKPPGPVKDADVQRWAEERGYHGALAIDRTWETLNRYWL